MIRRVRLWWRKRGKTQDQRDAIDAGLPEDFVLPYPCPRNEHEDGMNWVAVNGVVSGRGGPDW